MYYIATPRHKRRPNVYEGGVSEMSYQIDPRYGAHGSNIAAKRAFVEMWDAGFTGAPDNLIRLQFDRWRANLGIAKIVRERA